ncbi:hypothetical protein VDG1235_1216 [Verrucomicrobiia bacterium DG1235]|nr:hypothetical protein VDG1235_1216 [Verrucomicrobiae bacterium DG1235]
MASHKILPLTGRIVLLFDFKFDPLNLITMSIKLFGLSFNPLFDRCRHIAVNPRDTKLGTDFIIIYIQFSIHILDLLIYII